MPTPSRRTPLRRFARPALVVLAALSACAPSLALPRAAGAQPGGHGPPTGLPAPRGPGRFLPVIDGTVREPSVDRAEAVDEPDTVAVRRLLWEITLGGGATDHLQGGVDKRGLEAGAVSLTYGLGHGADLAARFDGWQRTRLDLPDTSGSEQAEGLGATTVTLGRTVRPPGWGGAGARYAAFVRFAGATAGPAPSEAEVGATFALDQPLGESTRLAVSATPAWVGDALDTGHHLEAAAGLVVTHDLLDRVSLWLEGVSVTSDEAARPWLGVVDGGLHLDLPGHVSVTLGASAGRGGGRNDTGALARIGVHS